VAATLSGTANTTSSGRRSAGSTCLAAMLVSGVGNCCVRWRGLMICKFMLARSTEIMCTCSSRYLRTCQCLGPCSISRAKVRTSYNETSKAFASVTGGSTCGAAAIGLHQAATSRMKYGKSTLKTRSRPNLMMTFRWCSPPRSSADRSGFQP